MEISLAARGFLVAVAAGLVSGCSAPPAQESTSPEQTTAAAMPAQSPVDRGRYLVTTSGCHDCHSPKNMTPEGPVPDMTRGLSGHPAAEKLPAVPAGVLSPGGWEFLGNGGFTGYVGPWGTSFARNITPDQATGIGSWTEQMFIDTIRLGKHQGTGRPLLPPMPWQVFAQMTDDDLKAIFAYLRTIPAIGNAVPDPIPPAGAPAR